MEALITPEIKTAIGNSLPPVTVEVTRRDIQKYSSATGHRLKKYIQGDEAPPLILFGLFRQISPYDSLRPDGLPEEAGLLPELPLKRVMAGGTESTYHLPIRPGDVLTATQTLVDIFEKQGSTGPLIFAVTETRIVNAAGELVAIDRTTRIAR